jgi:hypothetical protein
MDIIIGADELILWLRKNHKAANEINLHVGNRILQLIEGLGGMKYLDNQESFWDIGATARNVNELGLPQTSEQYRIPIGILPDIYREMDTW